MECQHQRVADILASESHLQSFHGSAQKQVTEEQLNGIVDKERMSEKQEGKWKRN
jgi:hypothetical protein